MTKQRTSPIASLLAGLHGKESVKVLGILTLMACALASCTNDGYDSGDGKWSYYTADFSLVHTAEANVIDYAVTDEGDSLVLQPHATASWATTPDSLYRALLYYNKVDSGTTSAFAVRQIPVLVPSASNDTLASDPLSLESAWVSTSGEYLNLSLLLKTGVADSIDNLQIVGVCLDTLSSQGQGSGHVYLELRHDQNGVPEYYTARQYVSIPLSDVPSGTTLHLSVTTYDGTIQRIFQRP